MNGLELVRTVFDKDIEEGEADTILWGCTGFPCFYRGDPVRFFYYQLQHAKRALALGFTIDDIFEGKDHLFCKCNTCGYAWRRNTLDDVGEIK